MTKVYLEYATERWCTSEPDPDDEWDNGDYGGSYTVTGVRLTPGWFDTYESPEEINEGDYVWVVWVSYDSGSTFGTDGGYGQVVAVTHEVELALAAEKWAEETICTDYAPWRKGKDNDRIKAAWPSDLGEVPYADWNGHFEHNQLVHTAGFIVRAA